MTTRIGTNMLFNTELASSSHMGNGLVQHHFAPTPPMSTYLVAWVLGPLVNDSMLVDGALINGEVRQHRISVWGTPQRFD